MNGPTVIWTHGWMMSRKVWERQRALSKHFRLIFWDLPREGPDGSALSLTDCANALRDLVNQSKIDEAVHVGWSMGMSVFWRYLELFGEAPFSKVVNIEMLPKMDPKVAMVDAVEKSMRRDRERAIRKFFGRIFHNVGVLLAAPLIEDLIHDSCDLPLDSVLSVYREMAEADFTEVAASFSGKQDLVFGRQGFYGGLEEFVKMFFPNSPIHWFEHSAHAPFWEEADAFNRLIEELISF